METILEDCVLEAAASRAIGWRRHRMEHYTMYSVICARNNSLVFRNHDKVKQSILMLKNNMPYLVSMYEKPSPIGRLLKSPRCASCPPRFPPLA